MSNSTENISSHYFFFYLGANRDNVLSQVIDFTLAQCIFIFFEL